MFLPSLLPRHQPSLVLTFTQAWRQRTVLWSRQGWSTTPSDFWGLLSTKAMALIGLLWALLSPSSCLPPFLHVLFFLPAALSQVSHWLLPISNLSTGSWMPVLGPVSPIPDLFFIVFSTATEQNLFTPCRAPGTSPNTVHSSSPQTAGVLAGIPQTLNPNTGLLALLAF